MKRYLLFGWTDFFLDGEPLKCGGGGGFIMDFDTVDGAFQHATDESLDEPLDHYHIVDLECGQVIAGGIERINP